jgi:hypothetical protein
LILASIYFGINATATTNIAMRAAGALMGVGS